ncbi:CapA family protein [Chryseobacterium phage MA9V-1]|nr:CapA family protein [Chryseobacterium phage MA9V-1]
MKNFFASNNIKILVAGDIMLHEPQLKYFNTLRKACNDDIDIMTKYLFNKDLRSLLTSSNVVIGNLETVTNDVLAYQGYPRFNAPTLLLQIVKRLGFTDLVVSNNHSKDHDYETWLETVESLKALGIRTHGDVEEAKSLKNLQTVKVIAGSDRFNKEFDDIVDSALANKYYKPLNKQQFITLNQAFTGYPRLLYFHAGKEYYEGISEDQADILKAIGNDSKILATLLTHSHVLGEAYKRNKHETKLENGLGNFTSMQEKLERQIGGIVEYSYNPKTNEFTFVKRHIVETVLNSDGSWQTRLIA